MRETWYQQLPAPALLADIVMTVHALIVLFVISMLLCTLIGWARRWQWVRNPWLRFIHVGMVLVVVVQTLRGRYCPLTYIEQDLRRAAGNRVEQASFIEYWVSQALYYDLPGWVFQLSYYSFGLLVLLTWWCYPPRLHRPRRNKSGRGD
jgi:ABC-type amino acid transport system permease subunit